MNNVITQISLVQKFRKFKSHAASKQFSKRKTLKKKLIQTLDP